MFGETFATINYFLSPEDFKDFRDLWKLYYMKKVAFVSIVWGYSDMLFTIFYVLEAFFICALEDIMDLSPFTEDFPDVNV